MRYRPPMPVVIIIAFIAIFITFAVFSAIAARKRRDAMAALAARLGLHFYPDHDSDMDGRYAFFEKLRQGSDRYAFNILTGDYRGEPVTVFDYHYATYSRDSKGRRRKHNHYFSFFILALPGSFPELKIGREGFLSKIAQAVGFDDIDFESHEFSRNFCVRSPDKKFAYDVCNARMIEYLLANGDLTIEIEHDALAIAFDSRLDPERVEGNLERLSQVRALMPNYLFE
jgi:hypothetical protein